MRESTRVRRGTGRCRPTPLRTVLQVTSEPCLARTDGPAYGSAVRALEGAFGTKIVHNGEGGSIRRVAAFHKALPDAEVIFSGPEEPQRRIHSPNESVDLGELGR